MCQPILTISQPHKEADRTPPFSPLGNPDISTHSLTRRLTTARQAAKGTGVFQLTASQGGWRLMAISSTPQKPISTHSLTRRLTSIGVQLVISLEFQLTASQGGWPRTVVELCHARDFNSQPHKEADHSTDRHLLMHRISTHSLTRRLTTCTPRISDSFTFQLTASQGGWPISLYCSECPETISTHSLTRGLTLISLFACYHNFNFNSQPHKEADELPGFTSEPVYVFQLTASQGGWHSCIAVWYMPEYFNSQPHKEAD